MPAPPTPVVGSGPVAAARARRAARMRPEPVTRTPIADSARAVVARTMARVPRVRPAISTRIAAPRAPAAAARAQPQGPAPRAPRPVTAARPAMAVRARAVPARRAPRLPVTKPLTVTAVFVAPSRARAREPARPVRKKVRLVRRIRSAAPATLAVLGPWLARSIPNARRSAPFATT